LGYSNVDTQALEDSDEYVAFRQQIGSLPTHKDGYHHLGDDGVYRSFTPTHEVLGAVPASPAIISRYVHDWRAGQEDEEVRKHLEEVYENVDGRDVTDPHTIHPTIINVGAADDTKKLLTARSDVHDAADLVIRDLSAPLQKRYCSVAGSACSASEPCMGQGCTCSYVDMLVTGECKDA
jgi:hypothetical protein